MDWAAVATEPVTTPPGAVYTLDVLDWSVAIGGRHLTAKIQ